MGKVEMIECDNCGEVAGKGASMYACKACGKYICEKCNDNNLSGVCPLCAPKTLELVK